MKKLMNGPERFVDEALHGIGLAHGDVWRCPLDGERAIALRAGAGAGRVGVVTGGGFGHLPVFLGYVGDGLATACAVGNVFSSPSEEAVLAAARAADGGAGLLMVYGNYNGDILVFDDACETLRGAGIEVDTVLVTDDVASGAPEQASTRRGVAGLGLALKVAGEASRRGLPLADVAAVTRRLVAATRTIGVGLSPTTLPTTGLPTFEIGEDEMELGIGIHGERGRRREPLRRADEVARELVDALLPELAAERVALMLNSLGATSPEELYVLHGTVVEALREAGRTPALTLVGRFATSMEMAGVSLTLVGLDAELEELLAAPASSPMVSFGWSRG